MEPNFSEFLAALDQIQKERKLPKNVILESVQAALANAYKTHKKHKTLKAEPRVEINTTTGNLTIYETKSITINDTPANDSEITLEQAAKWGYSDAQAGDFVEIPVPFNPAKFGRIAAQTMKQVILQRLRDAERNQVKYDFDSKIGTLIQGEVIKAEGNQITVRLADGNETQLPEDERIPGERYDCGCSMKFYLVDVKPGGSRGPRILISRTHPALLRKLMEQEVPEIREGLVEVKAIVREAGSRAKVAVAAKAPGQLATNRQSMPGASESAVMTERISKSVEPVGACVGEGGKRIQNVTRELHGEKIDVILHSEDQMEFIKNALAPAKIDYVEQVEKPGKLEKEKIAKAYATPDQLSLAIGKGGQNVRLAARLTGWKVDIGTGKPQSLQSKPDPKPENTDSTEKEA